MEEIWKDIKDFEGSYQVSNLGNVKRAAQTIVYKDGHTCNYLERAKASRPNTKGYIIVDLQKIGRKKTMYMHRLVATAFIPNPENKPTVNHKDGDKSNNTVPNLEWATMSENIEHAFQMKLNHHGEAHYLAILQENEVRAIRLLKGLKTEEELGRFFGVSRGTIHKAMVGKTWKRLEK